MKDKWRMNGGKMEVDIRLLKEKCFDICRIDGGEMTDRWS